MAEYFIHDFDLATVCTALNVATANVAASAVGYRGVGGVDFDKVTDAAITTAGVYVTLTRQAIRRYSFIGDNDYVSLVMDPQDVTNIASVSLRLGADASNYLTWTWADSTFTADRWNVSTARIGSGTPTLLGCNFGSIAYIAVYVTFDGSTNTLADMHLGRVALVEAGSV